MAPTPPSSVQRVTVVGENLRTTENLLRYLSSAGFESQALQKLPADDEVSSLGDTVVLFPDDFDTVAVLTTVASLRQRQPPLRLLLITNSPQHYQFPSLTGTAPLPVLLAKPAFGWSILDAIRALAPTEDEP